MLKPISQQLSANYTGSNFAYLNSGAQYRSNLSAMGIGAYNQNYINTSKTQGKTILDLASAVRGTPTRFSLNAQVLGMRIGSVRIKRPV